MLGAEEGGEDGLPQSVEVIDDALALRIPLGPDDSDNYVVGTSDTQAPSLPHPHRATGGGSQLIRPHMCAGLALDMTSTQVPVPHPLDAEADDLAPAPMLLAATSDGKLRFYTAGHLRRPMQGVVRPPTPLPPAPALVQPEPSESEAAPASGAGSSRPASADEDWVRVEQAAAVTALPSDGDDDEEDGELQDEEPRSRPPALPQDDTQAPADEQLQKAAAAGLPSSSDDENTERDSNSDDDDATSRPATGRMQMPPAQSSPQPAADATGASEAGASDDAKSLFGQGHRLSPAGAAAAARHAAASQPAVSGGGSVFGGAFSFAAPVGQSSGSQVAPGFNLSGAFGGPRPSAFSMPAFGQSTPVRPLFGAPPAAAKAAAAPPPTSAAAPAAAPGKKVPLRL